MPPPTDPEQAPTKAPIKSKNDIEKGQSEELPIVKPVVVIIETVWNANSLVDGVLSLWLKTLTIKATINIRRINDIKNFNSGSKAYFKGFLLYIAK
tara:strand:+ start:205 stop:492 length:288 start_codon:yes stop_codon:yes gene_type:complete